MSASKQREWLQTSMARGPALSFLKVTGLYELGFQVELRCLSVSVRCLSVSATAMQTGRLRSTQQKLLTERGNLDGGREGHWGDPLIRLSALDNPCITSVG